MIKSWFTALCLLNLFDLVYSIVTIKVLGLFYEFNPLIAWVFSVSLLESILVLFVIKAVPLAILYLILDKCNINIIRGLCFVYGTLVFYQIAIMALY